MNHTAKFWQSFGPGVLFAGAAIGTSHLVQSTRAGAMFGLGLLSVVILANLVKYPIYRFAPLYASATGNSLLQGYRRLGRAPVALVAVLELPVDIIIIAATAIATAGIAVSVFDLSTDVRVVAASLIVFAVVLVALGGYKVLDRFSKVFVGILTISTLAATIMVLPSVNWTISGLALPVIDKVTFAFLIALMGFMPAGVSLSLIHSIWSVEKAREAERPATRSQALLDFNIGYVGSTVLAVCFLIMGAGVMYGSGTEPANSAGAFAGQIISLYSDTLGVWSSVLVGVSVFAVMLTTLLAALDGFARIQDSALKLVFIDSAEQSATESSANRLHRLMTAVIGLGAILVLFLFMTSFKAFIDFVTITTFIVGPVIAVLNHIVMNSNDVPLELRPSRFMSAWSIFAITAMLGLSIVYLVLR